MESESPTSFDFVKILKTFGDIVAKIEIVIGVLVLVLGLIFLIFNRKVVKILYFFSGLTTFTIIPLIIGGTIIIFTNEGNNFEAQPFLILTGCSIAFGLFIGSLAAWSGRFGIIMIGGLAGLSLWSIIGQFINNQLANSICSVLSLIIFATLCGYFKRPAEIIASAIIGGKYFATGFGFIFDGTAALIVKDDWAELLKLIFFGMIGSLVLQVISTLISGIYYIVKHIRSNGDSYMGASSDKLNTIG